MLELSDSNYMNGLAEDQDLAASGFAEAGRKAEGFSKIVEETHGSFCHASIDALHEAESALGDLTKALDRRAKELAALVRRAGDMYRRADQLY